MSFYAHPAALVESEQIGDGTRIWAFAHVLNGAVIGADCTVGDHCYVENDVVVGDRVTVKNGVALWEGLTVEDEAFIGPFATFTNDRYPRSARARPGIARYAKKALWMEPTLIRHGATVGARAIIVCGVVIGQYAMVGAGAVVTRDVPDYALVVGSPARLRGYVCRCGLPLDMEGDRACCRGCSQSYTIVHYHVSPVED